MSDARIKLTTDGGAHIKYMTGGDAIINLTIDGKAVQAHAGQTILEAARANGIVIPTLCYHPRLLPIGSCRLCVVEIEGAERPMTACTTPAQEGIIVHTQTEQLNAMRRAALQLILTYHAPGLPPVRRRRGVRAAGSGRRLRHRPTALSGARESRRVCASSPPP